MNLKVENRWTFNEYNQGHVSLFADRTSFIQYFVTFVLLYVSKWQAYPGMDNLGVWEVLALAAE